jgi:hypothetical protein
MFAPARHVSQKLQINFQEETNVAGGPVVTKGASQAKTGARKSARAGGPVVTKAGSKGSKKSEKPAKKVVAMKAGKKRPSVKKSPKPGKPKRKKK